MKKYVFIFVGIIFLIILLVPQQSNYEKARVCFANGETKEGYEYILQGAKEYDEQCTRMLVLYGILDMKFRGKVYEIGLLRFSRIQGNSKFIDTIKKFEHFYKTSNSRSEKEQIIKRAKNYCLTEMRTE